MKRGKCPVCGAVWDVGHIYTVHHFRPLCVKCVEILNQVTSVKLWSLKGEGA